MKAVWNSIAKVDDVANLHLAMLGRRVELGVPENCGGQTFHEVVRGLAQSDEFSDKVLGALAAGSLPPQTRLSQNDLGRLLSWSMERFLHLGSVQLATETPSSFLAKFLSDPFIEKCVREIHGNVLATAQQRLRDIIATERAHAGNNHFGTEWFAMASLTDLKSLYLIFLGRPAEAEVIEQFVPKTIQELVIGLSISAEIDENVLHALVQHRGLPHENLTQETLLALEQWAEERLNLPAGGADSVGTPAALLGRFIAHRNLAQIMQDAHGSLFTQAQMELSMLIRVGHSRFKGRIEFANQEVISGFIIDLEGINSCPQVEIHHQGRLLGCASASVVREDLLRQFGGNGVAGFRAEWDPSKIAPGIIKLTLHEARSGIQLGSAYRFHNSFLDQLGIAQQLTKEFDDIKHRLDTLASIVPQALSYSAFPVEQYDLYRQSHRVPPPPKFSGRGKRFLVLLDAEQASSTAVRVSVDGLRGQSVDIEWHLVIVGSEVGAVEPVKALCAPDVRLDFVGNWRDAATILAGREVTDWVVLLQAGEHLDPEALGWIQECAQHETAVALYWDEDELLQREEGLFQSRTRFANPILRGPFDADSMLEMNVVGTSFAVRVDTLLQSINLLEANSARYASDLPLSQRSREVLIWAIHRHGDWMHIPHFLLTRMKRAGDQQTLPADERLIAQADPVAVNELLPAGWSSQTWHRVADPVLHASPKKLIRWEPVDPESVISVLMPTRDHADMVAICLDSLRNQADRPDLIEFIVADNDSQEAGTLRYLDDGQAAGHFTVLRVREPFNWSRLNNLMAQIARGKYFLFVNNDMRMLTRGWDHILRGQLERASIGALGARLLYEDMTLQHAGVVVGRGGLVAHDALGEEPDAPGSMHGSRLTRKMPAVTGAFLACKAATFEEVGDFDEINLPVTFNDVDWCWRLSRKFPNRSVLYTPLISLIHYESKSRGLDYANIEKMTRAIYESHRLLCLHGKEYPLKYSGNPKISAWTERVKGYF